MTDLIEKDIVRIGEILYIKNEEQSEATVIDDKYVDYKGNKMTFNEWGKTIKKWSTINNYENAFSKRLRCTLKEKLSREDKDS